MDASLETEDAKLFTITEDASWDDVQYIVPKDSPLALVIQEYIEAERLERQVDVGYLGQEHIGRTIRYNGDEEGVLEAVYHESEKTTHLTVAGRKLVSSAHYEKVVLLPPVPTEAP